MWVQWLRKCVTMQDHSCDMCQTVHHVTRLLPPCVRVCIRTQWAMLDCYAYLNYLSN